MRLFFFVGRIFASLCDTRMPTDPVLIAYGINITKTGRRVWARIGEAYPHREGAGLTVQLNALPSDGKVVLLELDENDDRWIATHARRLGDPT